MGDKRTIIGLVICFVVIILYFEILGRIRRREVPPPQPVPPAAQPAEIRPVPPYSPAGAQPTTGPATATTTPATATTTPARAAEIEPLPEQQDKDIVCETELLKIILTSRGAAIKSVRLGDYYTFADKRPGPEDSDPRLRLITEIEQGKLSLTMSETTGAGGLDSVVWEHVPGCPVPPDFSKAERFRARIPELGLEITKTFLFREPEHKKGMDRPIGGRDLVVEISVQNLGLRERLFQYNLRSVAGIVPEPDVPPKYPIEQQKSQDVAAVVGGLSGEAVSIETFAPDKVKDKPYRYSSAAASPIYAGVRNRYFAAVLEPITSKAEITAVLIEKIGENNVASTLEVSSERIPPGGVSTKRFMLFIAPRIPHVLRDYPGYHFEELVQ